MTYYFGKVLILKLVPLVNKILLFCFNLLVRHPYLLHCNLLESVCKSEQMTAVKKSAILPMQ